MASAYDYIRDVFVPPAKDYEYDVSTYGQRPSLYDYMAGPPTTTAYQNDPEYIRWAKNWLGPWVPAPTPDPHTTEGRVRTRTGDAVNLFSYTPAMTEENYKRGENAYRRLPANYAGELSSETRSQPFVNPEPGQPGSSVPVGPPKMTSGEAFRMGLDFVNPFSYPTYADFTKKYPPPSAPPPPPPPQQGPLYQPGYRRANPWINPDTRSAENENYLPFKARDTMSDRLYGLIGKNYDNDTWWMDKAKQGPLYQPYLTPQEPQQGPLYQPYLAEPRGMMGSSPGRSARILDILARLYGDRPSNNYLAMEQYNPAAMY